MLTTDTTVSTTVSTIADLALVLDAHLMALPAGDPGEGPTERACEVVGTIARYDGAARVWVCISCGDAPPPTAHEIALREIADADHEYRTRIGGAS